MSLSGILERKVRSYRIWRREDGELVIILLPVKGNTDGFLRDKFVCVEPGFVRGFVKISPGESWIGQQVLTVV